MKSNENQWFWYFSRFYGTRWYPTESRKRENIKKYFQTISDRSETYVSEGEKSSASLEWSTCDDLPSGFHEITKNLENQ